MRSLLLSSPILALLAGALTVLAFAPFGLWPFQIISLACMFHLLLRESTIKRWALIGWCYGFGWTVFGVYWLYITMHHYGHIPPWLSALAVGLMASCVLGPFFVFAFASAAWFRQRWSVSTSFMALLVLPATFALSEWLRGWILTGLPWVVSGYAHTASPLSGFAPILGVYGVGWIAALIAGCLALLPSKKQPILFALGILICGIGLQSIEWTQTHGQPISVRLLQGNVSQETKFEEDRREASLLLYQEMITAAPADLIATPETALPLFIHELPVDYLPHLAQFARNTNSHIVAGLMISDAPQQYANSVIGISPSSTSSLYRFSKHHLVPFGEYMPWGFRWFVEIMNIPMADQTPGATLQKPFEVKDQWVLPNICYEDLFGGEIAGQLSAHYFSGAPQATILLNLSNLAWFDDSTALPQHLQISQMRALETGRPMLRATNTGATAVIDHQGRVIEQLPFLTRGTLSTKVQGYSGVTPYILGGNSIAVFLCFLMLGCAWFFSVRTRQKSRV